MNKQYAEKIISSLKDDLENDSKGLNLIDDMCRAEKLFGKEIPEICDCMDEARSYSGTVHRNAETIILLLEMKLEEQATLSYALTDFKIKDTGFCKLIEQSFNLCQEGKIDMATEKLWDAFERIKTYYRKCDKKTSASKVVDTMSKRNSDFNKIISAEFSALTQIGNDFRIRHHETNKIDVCCKEHYDYLSYRCLSVLKLATAILKEVEADEIQF